MHLHHLGERSERVKKKQSFRLALQWDPKTVCSGAMSASMKQGMSWNSGRCWVVEMATLLMVVTIVREDKIGLV